MADLIWHPKMSFQNVVYVEKVRGFGYEELHEYYITYPNKIQMIENLKVTFACNFKLNTYPFEKHSCDFSLHDKIHTEESLILKPPALVFHENQYINIHNDSLLFLNTPKISFKVGVKVNPTKLYLQYNSNRYSVSSINLQIRRNSLGLLIGGFYVPTGIFAVLSMASYVINPAVVRIILEMFFAAYLQLMHNCI